MLEGREAHHASRVLRMEPGDKAIVLDGHGGEYGCHVGEVSKSRVSLVVDSTLNHSRLPFEVGLYAAIPKGQLFEQIVEQATELGVRRIVPLFADRSNVRFQPEVAVAKLEKWRMTAVEAMKQCGGPWLPEIAAPMSFSTALSGLVPEELSLVAALTGQTQEVHEVIQGMRTRTGVFPNRVSLWIGPEGDFTPEELNALLSNGVKPITLGPYVLRCPTAVVAAIAVVSQELRVVSGNAPAL